MISLRAKLFLGLSVVVLAVILPCLWVTGQSSTEVKFPLGNACERVYFETPLTWSFSASWDTKGAQALLFVDPSTGDIYSVDHKGTIDNLTDALKNDGKDIPVQASTIHSFADDRNYLIEDERSGGDSEFLLCAEDFNIIERYQISGRLDTDRNKLKTIYSWDAFDRYSPVLAFGDIELANGGHISAFINFRLESDSFEIIDSVGVDDRARTLYLLGYSYLSRLNPELSLLVNRKNDAFIESITLNERSLPRNKSRLNIPELQIALPPRKEGIRNLDDIFDTISRNRSFVAGLYSWEGRAFLLVRTNEVNRVAWELREISSTDGNTIHSYQIPSTAPHLMLVPGQEEWAIVEKGEVFRFGVQLIDSMLLLDSDVLRENKGNLKTNICG